MPRIIVSAPSGVSKEIFGEPGMTVMEAIRASGFDELLALCGGGLSCGTCHVYVKNPALSKILPEMEEEEKELLESFDNYRDSSRLSCQLMYDVMPDDLELEIPVEK